MAMFDDPNKELKKLEDQLLKDEQWLDRELAAARALIGEETPKKKKAPPVRGSADTQQKAARVVIPNTGDYDLDEKKVKKSKKKGKKKKSNRPLVILAVLETLGIVGVVVYWLIMLL